MTLGDKNKTKIKPQLGPAFWLNTTLSSQRDARKETFVDDQSTKDRQDVLLNPSLLSTSNVMVKLDLSLSLVNALNLFYIIKYYKMQPLITFSLHWQLVQ